MNPLRQNRSCPCGSSEAVRNPRMTVFSCGSVVATNDGKPLYVAPTCPRPQPPKENV